MVKELKKVPELRFPEFEGEWERSLLKNGISLTSGQHLSPDEYNNSRNGVPYFTGPSDYTNNVNNLTKWSTESSHFGRENEILITVKGSGVGALLFLKLSKVAMGRQLMAIKGESYATAFIFQVLITRKQLFEKLAYGNMIPGISRQDILHTKLFVPTLQEQQKIASFLAAVDKKIEQLTRKKELLEQYKKGVMQKIFSQEIRFSPKSSLRQAQGTGTGAGKLSERVGLPVAEPVEAYPDWEEKMLGEIASFLKGKGISKNDVTSDGDLKCIRYGELYTVYAEIISDVRSATKVDSSALILSKKNDVIIPSSGETHIDLATASYVQKEGIALGGDINIIRTKQNGVFFAYYLNNAKKCQIAGLAQGSSVIHLYSAHLKCLKISIPKIEEQQKIANFLTSIDNKINTTQTQLTKTQKFKKGLLQKMFV